VWVVTQGYGGSASLVVTAGFSIGMIVIPPEDSQPIELSSAVRGAIELTSVVRGPLSV
jgi:hypothetical protein